MCVYSKMCKNDSFCSKSKLETKASVQNNGKDVSTVVHYREQRTTVIYNNRDGWCDPEGEPQVTK